MGFINKQPRRVVIDSGWRSMSDYQRAIRAKMEPLFISILKRDCPIQETSQAAMEVMREADDKLMGAVK